MIVDKAGNYSHAYYICGIGMCLSGAILLLILVHRRCHASTSQDEEQPSKIENKLETIAEVC
jgi:hypothetical protein